MKTIPPIFTTHARSEELFYAVEISPNAGELWDAIRWSTRACRIDGNDYEGGALTKVGRVSYKAPIKLGGAAATRDRVELTARNIKSDGTNRFQDFADQPIGGRKVSLKVGIVPPNFLRNSSFEDESAGVFPYWTETIGSGGSVQRASGGVHGSYYCSIYTGTSPSSIRSFDFTVKRGQDIRISFYLRAGNAGDICDVSFRPSGSAYYWDIAGGVWSIGAGTSKSYTPTTSAGMERFDFLIPTEKIAELCDVYQPLGESLDFYLDFKVPTNGDLIFVDAAMVSPRDELFDYVPGIYDLIADDDLIDLYTGEVFDYDWTNQKIRIITRDLSSLRHRKIPLKKLDDEYLAAISKTWTIPPRHYGRPIPMTYGDFDISPKEQLGDPRLLVKTAAFGLLVNYDGAGTSGDEIRAIFDRPDGVTKLYACAELFYFDEDGQQFVHQYYDDRTTPDYCLQEFIDDKNNASFINHADAGFLMTGRLPLSIYCGGREVKDIATSLNDDPWDQPYEDIFDRSASTYVERNPLGEAPFEYSALIVYMEPMAFREAKLISVYCIAQAYLNVSVYSGDLVPAICFHHRDASSRNARIILSRNSVGITAFNNTPWNAGAQKETDLPYSITSPAAAANLSHWLSGDNSQWFEAYGGCWPITGSGTYSAIQRLHDVAVRIDLTIDLLDGELFGAVKGREYLSTWDTRKTTGNLIENPADVIESVLREELGVAGVDIDTGAFDAASSARSTNYDMAGQVVTVKDSEDVIDEVCKSSGLMYYNDLTGKEKLTPLDKKATQDFRFNYHDIIEDSIRVRFSRRDEVVSSFILNYAYNPISDSYRGRVYCNKDNSSFLSGGSTYENLCDAAYDITGLVVEREFNCKWINDSAIAHNHLKFLINWLTYLKTFVILETYFDQIGIELGDQGELALERHLPSTTEDSYFVVESISTKRSNRRIRFELIEIRAAS